jgi:hypothetical protein
LAREPLCKAVSGYIGSQQITAAQIANSDIETIDNLYNDKRYQPWPLVSQNGNYSLTETCVRQVFDLECTPAHPCKSTELPSGGGPIPLPDGARSKNGDVLVEVDSSAKNIMIGIPKSTGMRSKRPDGWIRPTRYSDYP